MDAGITCKYETDSSIWTNMAAYLVNYQAFLRKQTRYNATRGGTTFPIYSSRRDMRFGTLELMIFLVRSMALPPTVQDVLAYRPWHDSAQDSSWNSRFEPFEDIRGCPAPIRPQEAHGGASSPACSSPEARTQVLYRWSSWT